MGTSACLKKGELTWSGEINLGSSGPAGTPSIVINGGGSLTNNTSAVLNLSGASPVDMYITSAAGCASGGTWQTFSATYGYTLTPNVSNTVYVKFRDISLVESSCVSASILHDGIAPSVSIATPTNGSYINASTNSSTFSVSGSCSESSQMVTVKIDGSNAGLSQTGGLCNGATYSAQVNTTGLADGTRTFSAEITDAAGNFTASSSNNVVKDIVIPTVSITAPATASYINTSNNSATFSVSGPCSETGPTVVIKVDGSTAGLSQTGGVCNGSTFTAQVSTMGLAQGTRNFTAEISDTAGNPGGSSSNSVTKDITSPTVALTVPAASSYINTSNNSATFSVSGTCSEASQTVTIKVDGSTAGLSQTGGVCNGATFSAQVSTLSLSQGSRNFTAEILDLAGNLIVSSSNSAIKDTAVPTVAITTPANSSYINTSNNSATFSVTGTCSEVSQTVTIKVDGSTAGLSQTGGSCTGSTFSATVSTTGLSQGARNFTAEISDVAGNLVISASISVTKDTSLPSIAVSVPAASSYINISNNSASFTVSGTCSETSQPVTVRVDGSTAGLSQTGGLCNGATFSATVSTTGLAQGSRNFTADISDAAGNTNSSASNPVTKDTVAPSVSLSTPANGSYINTSTNSSAFSVSGTCNEASQLVTIKVDSSTAGLSQVGGTCDGATFSAQVDTMGLGSGARIFTAEITDLAGNLSGSGSNSVTKDITPPSWTNTLSHSPTNNSFTASPPLNYTADATDANGIAGYDYAIGTGTSGAAQSDKRAWGSAGGSPINDFGLSLNNVETYYFNMRVRDNAGNLSSVFSSSGWTVPLDVVAAYTNGSNWNDYVKNDGGTRYSATNTVCAGTEGPTYNGCIHGGEMRKVVINGVSSCAGLSMTDTLGAFDWVCLPVLGTATFFSSLKPNRGLKDLINGGSGTVWQTNKVTLSGTYSATSSMLTWLSNSILLLPDNSATAAVPLSGPGNIYTIIANRLSHGYNLNSDKISLVTLNGSKLSYAGSATSNCNYTTGEMATPADICLLSTGAQKHLWIEGEFEGFTTGTSATITLNFVNTNFSRIHQYKSYLGTTDLFYARSAQKNLFTDVTVTNGAAGLEMESCSNNMINGLRASNHNTFGLALNGSYGNQFNDVSAANNTQRGLVIFDVAGASNFNTFDGVFSYNNATAGVELNGSLVQNNTFSRVISTNNGDAGINLLNSRNNYFVRVTTAYNVNQNIYLSGAQYNTFHNFISYYSLDNIFVDNSPSNTFSQVVSTDWVAGGSSVYLNLSPSKFTGNFFVDNGCWIVGASQGLVDTTCLNNGSSNATLFMGSSIDTSTSFVSAVPSDTKNTSDSSGMASFPGASLTFDWFGFDNIFRTWGHASVGNLRWGSGSGRIWDWQIRVTDTLTRGKAGNGSTFETFVSGSPCPASVGGSNITSNLQTTTVTYLKNAVELLNSPILNPSGNNNGLCESNEACVFTSNFGAYQGHGNFGTCTFSSGTLVGITMYGFDSNGI
jgi:hypothetical protein